MVVHTLHTDTNRIVHAFIRPVDSDIDGHLAQLLTDRGWQVEEKSAGYRVTLRLYCAKMAAIGEARELLLNFSRSCAPIYIDEIRLDASPPDRRATVTAAQLWRPLGKRNPRAPWNIGPVSYFRTYWEVRVPPSMEGDPTERESDELQRAESRLALSQLPGTPFSRSAYRLFTEALVPPQFEWERTEAPTLMQRLLSGLLLSAALLVAILAGYSTNTLARASFAALTLGLSATGIHLVLAPRRKLLYRLLVTLLATAALLLAGWGLSKSIQEATAGPWNVLVALLLVLSIIGWKHLVIRHPSARRLFSIGVLTIIGAAATALAQFFISAISEVFGVPAGALEIPGSIHFVVTVAAILGTVFLLWTFGAVIGWVSYGGLLTGDLTYKFISGTLFGLAFLAVTLVAFASAIDFTQSTGLRWRQQLLAGNTPAPLSEFAYWACTSEKDAASDTGMATSEPLIIVDGPGSRIWSWDYDTTQHAGTLVPLDDSTVIVSIVEKRPAVCPLEHPLNTQRIDASAN